MSKVKLSTLLRCCYMQAISLQQSDKNYNIKIQKKTFPQQKMTNNSLTTRYIIPCSDFHNKHFSICFTVNFFKTLWGLFDVDRLYQFKVGKDMLVALNVCCTLCVYKRGITRLKLVCGLNDFSMLLITIIYHSVRLITFKAVGFFSISSFNDFLCKKNLHNEMKDVC